MFIILGMLVNELTKTKGKANYQEQAPLTTGEKVAFGLGCVVVALVFTALVLVCNYFGVY